MIIKGVGGLYSVSAADGIVTCTARGVFRNKKITPVVGDRVIVKDGVVHTILPRKNELTRPRVANVDLAAVIMAATRPEFNAGLLDRFLLLAEYAGVKALVCVNKCDLVSEDIFKTLTEPYITAGFPVFRVSVKNGLGIEALREALAGKTSVFAGPSGVGKSSIINTLTPCKQMETGTLSEKTERGKHTTRHTELLPILPSGFCTDTPGFTSLDLTKIPAKKSAGLFIEFAPFLNDCRFSDCRHDTEADCAVKAAVGSKIHPSRYDTYLRLLHDEKH